MRLIDADNLKVHVGAAVLDGNKEHKDRASALLRAIDRMPTAYDVDKVCRKINENKDMDNLIDADHAIKIVKSGGVE